VSPRLNRDRSRHGGLHASLRLSRNHRRSVYAILAATWISGVLWLIFHYFMTRQGEFGTEPHAFEAWSLRLHGAAAFAALWLGGLLWIVHVRAGLALPKRRVSGIVLIVLFVVLGASGYLLYYASDDYLRDCTRLLHWIVGVLLIVPFLMHSLRARRQRRAGAATVD
jgi:hypothetical protein